ncbi:MAG: ABC transporter ATP-binding protein [Oscillospiraceae bacterium]|nr:ABC transporter ATP-binding protein [Oscillospiraceae bacterium]
MKRPGSMGAPTGKKLDKKTLKRLLKYFKPYRFSLIIVFLCIAASAAVGVVSSIFLKTLIDDYINPLLLDSSADFSALLSVIIKMGYIYLIGVFAGFLYSRIMAIISQGILKKIRDEMFVHMQTLPIKYFDVHNHGDVMSRYTNDTDTLRQMISQSIPQVFSSIITAVAVFFAMLSLSIWLTLFVIICIFLIMIVMKKIASYSGKYFVNQQRAVGDVNGFIEEMINGQRVVKVFCRENKTKNIFEAKNSELCDYSTKANIYANVFMPIMNNFGYILYVLLAVTGGAMAIGGLTNVSLAGINTLTLGMIASFLNLSRSFIMPISQVSQQLSSIIMALAGAQRIFELIDEESENDAGYVTLVNAEYKDGVICETDKHTELWAWKHPHSADGSITYTPLDGKVEFFDVDFAYEEGKNVLNGVSLYAMPGQKVAFVGATGAGKTTITNLINRFYDIADGKIRYDGININKIKKSDLRRSLGMVLQDVNLFTGTVMENIRYGKLDATDEECVAAAKRANADGFIRMLPNGYETVLSGDGSGLSQGQRQLISIARAAVADPPVMILDEATSSIDTRTEAIVQRGMDSLMDGRTVFVIAHRLSTVKNSDVIMVLDHGNIIERGSHSKLISDKGTYYRLYTGAFELE